jgi:zinc transport system substrate-binding protein
MRALWRPLVSATAHPNRNGSRHTRQSAAFLGLLLLPAIAAPVRATAAAPRLLVAVTVPPQEWLVRRLAGDAVDVEVLLPPGASEHTYEPTPRQVARIAGARLLVEVGHPALLFERRLLAVLPREGRPLVVDLMHGAPTLAHGEGDTDEAGGDPHIWLSPAAMHQAAIAVADALGRLDPSHAGSVAARLPRTLTEIDAAGAAARAALDGLDGRRLYLDHPAWGYLLHGTGIAQVAIEAEGKEPGARSLVELTEQARRDRARAVFTQRGLSDRAARALAAELDARVVVVDPLASDWAANVRAVARLFAEALRG